MDDIRISDAGITSPDRGLTRGEAGLHDSIDMIDDELRRLLATGQPSDRSARHACRQTSGDADDRFADMIAQIEDALTDNSQASEQFAVYSVKKAGSALSQKMENLEVERRKTVVKSFQLKEITHREEYKEDQENECHVKSKVENKWAVVEGKRATIQPAKRQLKPLVEITNQPQKEKIVSVEKAVKDKQQHISCSPSSIIKASIPQPLAKKNAEPINKPQDNMIKKPRLISEESYIAEESHHSRYQSISRLPLSVKREIKKQAEESKKPLKASETTVTFSPIQQKQENTTTKSTAEDLLTLSEGSASKHMTIRQKEELEKLILNMKLTEIRSKFEYLVKKQRSSDGLVFIKLVADITKDSQMACQSISTTPEGKNLSQSLKRLMEKVKELGKTMAMLKTTEDTRLSAAIVENLTGDIQAVIKVISSNTQSQYSNTKPTNSIEEKIKLTTSVKNDQKLKKDEELELCVKRSQQKVNPSRDKLSARLDFDGAASSNTKSSKYEQPFQAQTDHHNLNLRRLPNRPREYIHNDASKDDNKEAELITSQRFGCRVYCIKLMSKKLLCGFEDGTLSVFSVNRFEGLTLEKSGKLHPRGISSITCTSPEQRKGLIFTGYSGSLSCSIVVWDAASIKPLKELCGHTGTISSLQYIVPNYLVSTSFDRRVIFWDLDECEATLSSEVHQTPILSSHYDTNSKCLYTGSLDGCIVISGLVIDEGELIDLKIFKKIAGSGPILQLASCLDDRLLSLQNSKLIVYDTRGFQCKEIKTNTIPTSIQMIDEEKGLFVDAEGRPQAVDLVKTKEPKREYGGYSSATVDKSSLLLASRLNGANCAAQLYYDASMPIIITANEKLDMIAMYRIK
jgi:hypothetical protein